MSDVVVVGGGAWGLPTALQLQDRGHRVTLVERFTSGGPYASSGGTTRLWRLADPQLWRTRALLRTVPAMERLGERLGKAIHRRTGMLWRDDVSLPAVAEAMETLGLEFSRVPAADVGAFFAGLRPDHRDALFVPQAGTVLAQTLLESALREFVTAGGNYLSGTRVRGVRPGEFSTAVILDDGSSLEAEQVLVTAGPGTPELLPDLGLRLPLRPYMEQVVHFGDPARTPPAPDLPGLFDGPVGDEPGIYAMPAQGDGYKIGLDLPLRPLQDAALGEDLEREVRPERSETLRARVERDMAEIAPRVLSAQVCTWTDSGDGDFLIGRSHPSVVLACGDSGEGFKFSAFMGEYLADMVEGGPGDPEFQEYWRLDRFDPGMLPREDIDAIGRH